MAITYCGVAKDSPRTATTDDKGVTKSERVYLFTVDSPAYTEFDIGTHASCPRIGYAHPDNPGLFARNITITNYEPYAGWQVAVGYSNESELRENPLDDPAVITFDDEQYQKPITKDLDGKAIVNTAGDPYDPPPMIDDGRISVTITKNLPDIPTWWLSYKDVVNSDTFTVRGLSVSPRLAKIQRRSISDWKYRNDIRYLEVSLTIHLDEDGWNVKPLNAGFRRKFNGDERELITMTNENGETEYPPAPVPLDASGIEIVDPTPDNVIYGDHKAYKEKPFSVLPLE